MLFRPAWHTCLLGLVMDWRKGLHGSSPLETFALFFGSVLCAQLRGKSRTYVTSYTQRNLFHQLASLRFLPYCLDPKVLFSLNLWSERFIFLRLLAFSPVKRFLMTGASHFEDNYLYSDFSPQSTCYFFYFSESSVVYFAFCSEYLIVNQ